MPHLPVAFIWILSLGSILLMLLRPRGIAEAWWIGGGALLLVLTRLLPLAAAGHAIREGLDVYLFLIGMMLLAETARHEGVFDWLAGIAVAHARGSASRLFLLIYLSGTIVTVFLSNDATAVVLTPAVLAAVRHANLRPRPYLLICAFIANAASFVLPISNPANLVIFDAHMPTLANWLRIFLLPSIASIVATYFILYFRSRPELDETIKVTVTPSSLSDGGKAALAGIVVSAAVLLAASGLGWQLGAPTCAVGVLAVLMVTLRDRRAALTVVRGVSWSIVPLVAGLFMIVEALNRGGMLEMAERGLRWAAGLPPVTGKLAAGFSVALLSNGMNNLPVGLASGSALRHAQLGGAIQHAVLVGVDLGPNLSVTGSLATILWLIALRREGVEITAAEFLKAGMIAMPIALLASLLVLF
ncbi:MAG TPA: arsenic transporter [Acidobacteriaceae bacterium]|nr:arsenic transporter [Acidobacteriaceae bacterium]